MTKEIIAALCKFLQEVPALTSMTTAKIATKNGRGFEFDFAELGYICSVINPILSAITSASSSYGSFIPTNSVLRVFIRLLCFANVQAIASLDL